MDGKREKYAETPPIKPTLLSFLLFLSCAWSLVHMATPITLHACLTYLLMSFIPHPLIFIISTCMKPHACGHLHSIPIYPSCMHAVIPISSSYLSLIADIITKHTTPFLFSTASPVSFHHSRPAVSTPITIRTRVLQDQ